MRGATHGIVLFSKPLIFLLTRPMRGATISLLFLSATSSEFLLTRPMRGATGGADPDDITIAISTHTPHAGRDAYWSEDWGSNTISTHTPHAGRDSYI